MHLSQFWNDPRLSFADTGKLREIVLSGDVAKDTLWTPDTYFANAKDVARHEAPVRNAYFRIRPNGDVELSERCGLYDAPLCYCACLDVIIFLLRLNVKASCSVDLQYYPLDRQLCYLELESCENFSSGGP